jgi:hypothetical protein
LCKMVVEREILAMNLENEHKHGSNIKQNIDISVFLDNMSSSI